MTEADLSECRALGGMIAEMEAKLIYWQRQRGTADQIVEKLSERLGELQMRQKALMGVKAAGAAG